MTVFRSPATTASVLDVLERVLDRGIVIEAWVGVSVAGIQVLEVETRIVVASLATYVSHQEALADAGAAVRAPLTTGGARRRARAESAGSRRLRCAAGCTFERSRKARVPATVSCPYHPRQRCPVRAL
jgi:hypothetical protein